jgi:NADH-quinone oxidoreductase subunit H
MINVSAVATTLFLGGWHAPWPISAINDGMFNTGYWPVLWFLGKLWFFMFVFVWLRGTLLRLRYDQFMKFGWKILIPAALLWIVAVALVQSLVQFIQIEQQQLLLGLGISAGALLIIAWFWPETVPPQASAAPSEPFDAFADGYPVPPLPGQTLPPSPRRAVATVDVVAGQPTPDESSDDPTGQEEDRG